MHRDFITLSPEEQALVERMEAKYPAMSFAPQAVSVARAHEILDFVRAHPDDADAQRAALLSGGNWEGARMAYEAVCAAQNEFFISYFESHGLEYPQVPRDAHKSFINRRFADSEYTEVKTQRDEARAEAHLYRTQNEQLVRNVNYLLATVDDLKLNLLVDQEHSKELLDKIEQVVASITAQQAPAAPQAPLPPKGGGDGGSDSGELEQTHSTGEPTMVEQLFEDMRADQFRPWIKDPQVREWFTSVLETAKDSDEAVFVHTDALLDRKGCLLDDIDLPEFSRAMSAACKVGKKCTSRTLRDKLHDLFLLRKNRK